MNGHGKEFHRCAKTRLYSRATEKSSECVTNGFIAGAIQFLPKYGSQMRRSHEYPMHITYNIVNSKRYSCVV